MDLKNCQLCPNACGTDRTQKAGACHAPMEPRICRAALHMWEEPIISGERGSGTIFFAGCSLSCVFCQNYEISHREIGRIYSREELINTMKSLEAEGAHNINFVNPTHYAHVLRDALEHYRPSVPVVYNSGGYDKADTLRELDGLIDAYLPDLKYLTPETAKRYSGRQNYPEVACAALNEMFRQVGKIEIKDGILQRGMIVRHLVLPGQSEEGVRVVEYLGNRFKDEIYISIMSQYTPHGESAHFPEINRRLKPIEYKRVVAAVRRMGLMNCYTQEMESGDAAYIPPFDLGE